MRRTFQELISGFAAEQGCEYAGQEGTCQATLTVDGFELHLGLVEQSGMLIVQAGVGLLPRHDREALLLRLLAANNLFNETYGLTLGLDLAQELITLQLAWDITALSKEGFTHLMQNMALATAQWLQLLDKGVEKDNLVGSTRQSDDSASATVISANNFIRV